MGRTILTAILSILTVSGAAWMALGQGFVVPRGVPIESRNEVLSIALWPNREAGLSSAESDRLRLETALASLIAEDSGEEKTYSRVEVTILQDVREVGNNLERGSHTLIECDPCLYLTTRKQTRLIEWPYTVRLQRTSNSPLQDVIVLGPGRHGTDPGALRERWVGFPDPSSGPSAMTRLMFQERGIVPGRDFPVRYYGSGSNGLACLERGIIDAAVLPQSLVPEDRGFQILAKTPPFPPPLFAVRVTDLEEFPVLSRKVLSTVRRVLGEVEVVSARDDYYRPLMERLFGRESGGER